MKREIVIRLEGEVRADGSVYVTCPDLPLFHVLAPSEDEAEEFVLQVLREYISRNVPGEVTLRKSEPAESLFDGHKKFPTIPSHVIAERAA